MAINPVDLGFAEFVSTLLSETVDAVVASLTQQEEHRLDLAEAAATDLDAFAASNVADLEVDQLAAQLFPDGDGGTLIRAANAAPDAAELAGIGIELGSGEVVSGKLTGSGVAAVRNGLRTLIADRRLAALRSAVGEGLPRVVVDEGRIAVKLAFQTVLVDDRGTDDADDEPVGADDDAAEVEPAADRLAVSNRLSARTEPIFAKPSRVAATGPVSAAAASRLTGLKVGLAPNISAAIRDVRVKVQPASGSASESAQAQLHGEVEIRFRTVF